MQKIISQFWENIQSNLFPWLEKELSSLSIKQKQLVAILEFIRIEEFIQPFHAGFRGRPPKSRRAIARAFVAKAVYNMPTSTMLVERLHSDPSLRRICGWEERYDIPNESVFSRAFAEFANSDLPSKTHEALIKMVYKDEIVGHVIIDASAIEAREKSLKKSKKAPEEKTKKNETTRIEKQALGLMTLEEMIDDLPMQCDTGAKTNANKHKSWWRGYKLHTSVDYNGVPLAAILSAASMHDSQAAIPLARLTAQRVFNFYDLMDSGYHMEAIAEHSKALGHVPILERQPRKTGEKETKRQEKLAQEALNWKPAEMIRFENRTVIERTFSRLKDEFGGRFVRVRGVAKVSAHLMFGLLALAADQLIKLVT